MKNNRISKVILLLILLLSPILMGNSGCDGDDIKEKVTGIETTIQIEQIEVEVNDD